MTFRDCLADIVGARVSVKAKSELYKKILEQEVGFFDQTKSGITSHLFLKRKHITLKIVNNKIYG